MLSRHHLGQSQYKVLKRKYLFEGYLYSGDEHKTCFLKDVKRRVVINGQVNTVKVLNHNIMSKGNEKVLKKEIIFMQISLFIM